VIKYGKWSGMEWNNMEQKANADKRTRQEQVLSQTVRVWYGK
jgi:hypothetical protein